jgi:Ran GTPase-activating protein 1
MVENVSGVAMHFELDSSVREALTKERAEELLVGLGVGVESVRLGGKSFGDGSAEVAAAALVLASPTLRNLDLADVIASRPEEEAKRALAALAGGVASAKSLVSIDLSDNALGAKGIRAIGDILAGQTALESLKLCNNGLAADAGELITAALTATTPTLLTTLHFHNNLLETAGAVALAPVLEASPALRDFRFSALRVHHDGAVRICRALAPNASALVRLNLSDNNFGADGAAALAEALSAAPALEELNLRDAALTDDGVVLVLRAVAASGGRGMRVLDLSANEMGTAGAKALRKALKKMPCLESLMVEDNELGSGGAKQIAGGLSAAVHRALREIVAAGSEIGTAGAMALAKVAATLPALESVNLNANAIDADVVSDIQELLDEKLASLSDNDDDGEDEDEDEDEESVEEEEEDSDEGEEEEAAKESKVGAEGYKEKAAASEEASASVDELTSAVEQLTVNKAKAEW